VLQRTSWQHVSLIVLHLHGRCVAYWYALVRCLYQLGRAGCVLYFCPGRACLPGHCFPAALLCPEPSLVHKSLCSATSKSSMPPTPTPTLLPPSTPAQSPCRAHRRRAHPHGCAAGAPQTSCARRARHAALSCVSSSSQAQDVGHRGGPALGTGSWVVVRAAKSKGTAGGVLIAAAVHISVIDVLAVSRC
jgi:hypothetical protein